MNKSSISIDALINADVKTVWQAYTRVEDIMQWNQASPDWHCPEAYCELRVDGPFKYKMAAKDGSFSFEYEGRYTEVIPPNLLAFELADGRKVRVDFKEIEGKTLVVTTFETEDVNPIKSQQDGWQAILNSFKTYVDTKNNSV
ncbi:SRPBCC domain-containing protein [Sphingobacterium sp. HJSM2_6]|uniref:SRPBCC domain-containing protein n=1 Tax=Sphingobacterium sp. HJSM2_6 TaxID=3366264 RepID=UPI003BC2D2F3